ncbi:alpha/beta fold hydrolase [Halarchaeum sp. P4]|uniref:alpha/beta fold hydrolase n=1 Tax=Halarchaeum sp. P4 TaxID=3421639 RepID=UPI003EBFFA06
MPSHPELFRRRADVLSTDRGSGPAVVFAHGTFMDRTMFDPQVAELAPDYRCVAYDSRARTDSYAGDYDLDDLAADCVELMDGKGIDSAMLVGMSVGGFTALRVALDYPDRVDGLVLIDAPAGPTTPAERETYERIVEDLRETDLVPSTLARQVAERVTSETTQEEKPELLDAWAERWETYPGDAVASEYESWYRKDGDLDRLEEVDVPALVVHGEEDVFDVERAERTAEGLPDADLVRVPEAGHLSNLERPGVVTDALREFLDETTAVADDGGD